MPISKLKYQAHNNPPMKFRAPSTVNWKYPAESQRRLHLSHGLGFGPKSNVSQQAVSAGVVFVDFRFSNQLEHRNELLHAGQGQLAVRNRITETEAVLKAAQATLVSAAEKRRVEIGRA